MSLFYKIESVLYEWVNFVRREFCTALEFFELNEDDDFDDGASGGDEISGGCRGASRRQQIVDDDHASARLECITLHFDCVLKI